MLKYQFAINEPQTLDDGTVLPIKMVPDMADRNNHMDETHHDLSNKHDSGGKHQQLIRSSRESAKTS